MYGYGFMQSACVVFVLNEGWADGVGGIITMHIVSESGAPYECVAVSQHNEPCLHVRCLPAWTLSTFPSARLIRNISNIRDVFLLISLPDPGDGTPVSSDSAAYTRVPNVSSLSYKPNLLII